MGPYYVAFRDVGDRMVPASANGRLALYSDLDAARASSGALGVGACVGWARVLELCQQHGLQVPKNGQGGEQLD